MRNLRGGLCLGLGALVVPPPSFAQILKDLEPIRLEYRVLLGKEAEPAGRAVISFERVDTEGGERLRVESRIEHEIHRPSTYLFSEAITLLCDTRGVVDFEVLRKLGDRQRKISGRRLRDQYEVTIEAHGGSRHKRVSAEIRRTRLGLFCGGFLDEPLDSGAIMRAYPLLNPTLGEVEPSQKVREGIAPYALASGATVSVIRTRMFKEDKTSDKYLNLNDDHQALVRLEESSEFGRRIFELTGINGEPTSLGAELR